MRTSGRASSSGPCRCCASPRPTRSGWWIWPTASSPSWRGYTDESAVIFAETDGVPHNTITPIARRRGEDYELDLVLRNNLTTPEHPLGLYHPHAELHHIKKENIGLIEVMGLAVLPARLKEELAAVADALVSGADLRADELHGQARRLGGGLPEQIRPSRRTTPWTSCRRRPVWSLPRCWSTPGSTGGMRPDGRPSSGS